MAYQSEKTTPRPPLREAHRETDASEAELVRQDAYVIDRDAMRPPVEIEQFPTRAGGSDRHPKHCPLREVNINRSPDVPRASTPLNGTNECECNSKWFARLKRVPMVTWTILALFALWFFCQLVPLFSLIIGCHGLRFYAALLFLLVPIALLVFILVRAFLLFRKLPSFPQVNENGAKAFEVKGKLLHGYLEGLPESGKYAVAAGFKDNQKDEVVKVLNRLRGKGSHYSDEVGWLDDFKCFKDLQRKRADNIIGNYSRLIGFKTAASPWKFVDIICVFFNSTLMVADLANLYNRRVSKNATFRLVLRWFLNIYISGELGEISEKAAAVVGEQLKEPVKQELSSLDWMDSDWTGAVAQSMPLLAKFAGKIAEGGVNAYFAIRMGRKAVAAFEPFVSDAEH